MDLHSVLVRDRGSVQGSSLPARLKRIFSTVWNMSMKGAINQSVSRSAFVCQSQSMNLYQENPSSQSVSSMLFYAWGKGLKTGMYYLRTRPKAAPVQFTVTREAKESANAPLEGCISCGS